MSSNQTGGGPSKVGGAESREPPFSGHNIFAPWHSHMLVVRIAIHSSSSLATARPLATAFAAIKKRHRLLQSICERCVFVGTKTTLEWFCRLSWWDSPTQRARMRSGLLAANSGFMVGIGLFRDGFGGVCDGFGGDNNTGFRSLKPLDRSPDASGFRQRQVCSA